MAYILLVYRVLINIIDWLTDRYFAKVDVLLKLVHRVVEGLVGGEPEQWQRPVLRGQGQRL